MHGIHSIGQIRKWRLFRKWTSCLTVKQTEKVLRVTNRMGADFYTDDLRPHHDRIDGLHRATSFESVP